MIRSFDLDSKYIQLEITESATIDNNEIFNLLEQFHMAGFKILLDDFGSGYSSLATLNRMHLIRSSWIRVLSITLETTMEKTFEFHHEDGTELWHGNHGRRCGDGRAADVFM